MLLAESLAISVAGLPNRSCACKPVFYFLLLHLWFVPFVGLVIVLTSLSVLLLICPLTHHTRNDAYAQASVDTKMARPKPGHHQLPVTKERSHLRLYLATVHVRAGRFNHWTETWAVGRRPALVAVHLIHAARVRVCPEDYPGSPLVGDLYVEFDFDLLPWHAQSIARVYAYVQA